jgi:hypothetical protein
MERQRLATFTLLAFVVGLSAGAAAVVGSDPSRLDAADPDPSSPRLATGGVTMEFTNRGSRSTDVVIEVRDEDGTGVFQSAFPVAPGATVTRNIVSLVEGEYEARATVRSGAEGTGRFHTTDCAGRVYLAFQLVDDVTGRRVTSPRQHCG